jgi:hypothetical protein
MPLDAGQILRRAPLIDPNLEGAHLRSRPQATTNVFYTSALVRRREGRLSTAVVHLICNQGVTGSNPVAGTRLSLSDPDTWVTKRT